MYCPSYARIGAVVMVWSLTCVADRIVRCPGLVLYSTVRGEMPRTSSWQREYARSDAQD